MRYRFIEKHRSRYPVQKMCQVLKVTRSAYYSWLKHKPSKRAQEEEIILVKLRAAFEKSRKNYGIKRLQKKLEQQGIKIGKNRIARLKAKYNIYPKGRKRKYQKQKAELPASPNLKPQGFRPEEKNKVWATDITYLKAGSKTYYLTAIIDHYHKKIVGYHVSNNLRTEIVLQALEKAIKRERPQPGLILHSDQGSQFTSHAYAACLAKHGIISSMSRRGNCYDNAGMESFFSRFKIECDLSNIANQAELEKAIFSYIEGYYNTTRLHSANGYRSPLEMERHSLPA